MNKNNKAFDAIAYGTVLPVFFTAFFPPMLALKESPKESIASAVVEEGIIPRDAIKIFDVRDVPAVGEQKYISGTYHMYPCEEKYFSPAILNKNDLKVVVSIRRKNE